MDCQEYGYPSGYSPLHYAGEEKTPTRPFARVETRP